MNKCVLFSVFLLVTCYTSKAQDSLTQKNKELIEQLKNRINKIENKAVKDPAMELEKLTLQLKAKSDSIDLLIKELKKVKEDPSAFTKNYMVLTGDNYITYLFNMKETQFDYTSSPELDAFMKKYDGTKSLVIKGHADKSGLEENNVKFSMQRAQNLARFVSKKYNIDAAKIKVMWYGSTIPLPNSNNSNAHLNRRVELSLN